MKCHYVFDEKSKTRVLIPGCWPVTLSNNIEDCDCITHKKSDKNEVSELKNTIKQLEKINISLSKRLEKLTSR